MCTNGSKYPDSRQSCSFPVLTGEEAAAWDRFSIEEKKIDSRLLMGWAGYSAFLHIRSLGSFHDAPRIHLLCGTGNNGGDGYVIAWQMLTSSEKPMVVWQTGEPSTKDAAYFYDMCRDSNFTDRIAFYPLDKITLPGFEPAPVKNEVVIDAVFGTGLNKPLSPEMAATFSRVNRLPVTRIAIDIPSGVYAGGDFFNHEAFHAHETITFGSYKTGQLLEPGILHCGKLNVFPIGFYPLDDFPNRRLALPAGADGFTRLRQPDGHKYKSGVMKILGGSAGMEGAAILAARAFLALGGGLARIYSASGKIHTALADTPELMIESRDSAKELEGILLNAKTTTSEIFVIGPGLGFSPSREFWQEILSRPSSRVIVDGSALNSLYETLEIFKNQAKTGAMVLLTPHRNEAENLLGHKIGNMREAALKISELYNSHVYLKGPGGILILRSGDTAEEVYMGSSHFQLATGGTGDVLCGVIGNFICRAINREENPESPKAVNSAIEAGLVTYLEAAAAVVKKNSGNQDFLTPSEFISELRDLL